MVRRTTHEPNRSQIMPTGPLLPSHSDVRRTRPFLNHATADRARRPCGLSARSGSRPEFPHGALPWAVLMPTAPGKAAASRVRTDECESDAGTVGAARARSGGRPYVDDHRRAAGSDGKPIAAEPLRRSPARSRHGRARRATGRKDRRRAEKKIRTSSTYGPVRLHGAPW